MVETATREQLGLKLHHIGIVADDIDAKRGFYEGMLGYNAITPIIHDPLATAFVQFLSLDGADYYIELVAPDGQESKLARASKKGMPLNHLCYSTTAIERALEYFRGSGSFIVQEPTTAIAFGGRRIAWLLTPDSLLIELVERGGPKDL